MIGTQGIVVSMHLSKTTMAKAEISSSKLSLLLTLHSAEWLSDNFLITDDYCPEVSLRIWPSSCPRRPENMCEIFSGTPALRRYGSSVTRSLTRRAQPSFPSTGEPMRLPSYDL